MNPISVQGLYAIVDPSLCGSHDPFELALQYVKGGARLLQWREKGVERIKLLRHCQRIIELKKDHSFLFIVNDDPFVAAEVGADGVHLGQNDRSVSEARAIVGPKKLIGRSTHSLAEVEQALKEDINYLALGAIFPTKSKPPTHPVVGLELLRQVATLSEKPVVAIGGINRSNLDEVLKAGARAVAMISALYQGSPEEEVRFYAQKITHHRRT